MNRARFHRWVVGIERQCHVSANTGGREPVLRPEQGWRRSRWRKRRHRSFSMAAAARPYWTGFLKLSLVTISVRLYTATTERERIRFHMIHEPTGERVRQQLVVPGTGPVERDEVVKGYEYEKGRYVTVDPDDLKRLRLETTDTIDITEFVEDIDPIYFDAPYYLVPDGSVAEEGYRVIREALRESGKIAIGQVVVGGQERIVAIRPMGKGLLAN